MGGDRGQKQVGDAELLIITRGAGYSTVRGFRVCDFKLWYQKRFIVF